MPRAQVLGTFSFDAAASQSEVFHLVTPEGEREWDSSWNPMYVTSAELKVGTVFETDDDQARRLWLVDAYDPAGCRIRYVVVRPEHSLTTIDVAVDGASDGKSRVTVTYYRVALSEAGNGEVEAFGHDLPHMASHWSEAFARALNAKQG